MKGRKDKRPFGWVLAHVIFSALSVGWTLQSLQPRSTEDEPQSRALAAVSLQLGSAAFIWHASILCSIIGMGFFKETEER
ncbi:hypothetical protein SAMN05421677_1314 [Halobacillus aidingensis]|uniref:Uncharacterized protein n=1 Tax=Halobacillus aidingensis TaxID=240303 RepID=A0A1H0V5B9_HALAD|nr:hypothetical protein SAMN05421677_1314 [Halobacillus aidingensis]